MDFEKLVLFKTTHACDMLKKWGGMMTTTSFEAKCWKCGHVINPQPLNMEGVERTWRQEPYTFPPGHDSPFHPGHPGMPGSPKDHGWGSDHISHRDSPQHRSVNAGICPVCGARLTW